MLAFHRSGQQFQPVRAVKFWAVAANGTSNAPVLVTNLTIDATLGDAVPVQEYICTMPATNFANGVWVTNHFTVYPWVGDSNAVVSTDRRVEPWNTDKSGIAPYYMPYPLLCDRFGLYGSTVAVVSTNGSDAAGRVVSSSAFHPSTPPDAFLTVNGAAVAIARTNGLWFGLGRSNCGGSVIYLQEGQYNWTGGSGARGRRPDTWTMVDAFPGAAWTNIVFTNRNNNLGNVSGSGGLDWVRNVTFRVPSGGTIRYQHLLWMDHCYIDCSEATVFYQPTNVFLTACTVVTNGFAGLNYLNPSPTTFHLIRGCEFAPFGIGGIQIHTVIGNLRRMDNLSGTNTTLKFRQCFDLPPRDSHDGLFAYNKLFYLASANGGSAVDLYKSGDTGGNSGRFDCSGLVIAGNMMELHKGSDATGMPVLSVAWGEMNVPTSNKVNNVIIWNNTFVGNRCNLGEDVEGNGTHNGGIPNERYFWSVKNNWFGSANTKHDADYYPNGGRIHGWPVLYAVGWAGNWDVRGAYDCSWYLAVAGVPGIQPSSCSNARTNWPAFVNFRGYQGQGNPASNTGGGDYHLLSTSPGINFGTSLASQQLFPFDIEGAPRHRGGAIGAYEYIPPPPILTEPTVVDPARTSARILWDTERAADSRVDFGTTAALGITAADSNMISEHSVLLSGLLPGTTYHFQASSTDEWGQTSASAIRTFETLSANDAPVAASDAYMGLEDEILTVNDPGVLGNDTDPDGGTLVAVLENSPSHGTLQFEAPGGFVYTPAPNFHGNDSFSYRADDGQLQSAAVTVTLSVAAVNDPPVAQGQSVATAEDTPLAITLNGTDADGDSLSFAVATAPTHGTLTGTAPALTYTPAPNYNEPDSFTFTVSDGHGGSTTAAVTITVRPCANTCQQHPIDVPGPIGSEISSHRQSPGRRCERKTHVRSNRQE